MTAEEAAALREMADEAHTDWQAMEEAARTYGVAMKTVVDEAGNETQVLDESLLGLGHAQAKLTDEAGRLAAAWDLLTGEGARTGAAIRGMTDEAQGFVTKALEMGIALPAAMQPMIEKMIEQRRLTDQNGKKLTDLSQLQFAAPLTSGFDLLADKIQMLIIALGGPSGLSKAVEEMVASAGLQTTELAGEWAAMTTDMKAQFGSFEAFVEFRAMVARAGVSFDTMQSRWAAMTDKQQQRYGTFEAYVREQVLRKMARDAGLTWKTMRTDWAAMTDAQQRRGVAGAGGSLPHGGHGAKSDPVVGVRHLELGGPRLHDHHGAYHAYGDAVGGRHDRGHGGERDRHGRRHRLRGILRGVSAWRVT